MRYIVMVTVMVLTCLDLSTAQARIPYEPESLAGLPGVVVVVETITPEAQADGLSEGAIKETVTRILQSSDIRIFIESNALKKHSHSWLYVQPSIDKEGPYYFYNVSLRLIQEVSSVHGKHHTMAATTREVDVTERWAKTFADDFLAVNPQ